MRQYRHGVSPQGESKSGCRLLFLHPDLVAIRALPLPLPVIDVALNLLHWDLALWTSHLSSSIALGPAPTPGNRSRPDESCNLNSSDNFLGDTYCDEANPPIRAYAPGYCRSVPYLPSGRPIHRRTGRNGSRSLLRPQGRNGREGIYTSGARHGYCTTQHRSPSRFPGPATVPVNRYGQRNPVRAVEYF
jgi:hypothetical protein